MNSQSSGRGTRWVWVASLLAVATCLTPADLFAGECTESDREYIRKIAEAYSKKSPRLGESPYCLKCLPEDYERWAGPMAAARFDQCRKSSLRTELAAVCLPILDATWELKEDEFDPRRTVARLLAYYGFERLGSHDIFEIVTQGSVPDYMALAALRDPRTTDLLVRRYDSIAGLPASPQHTTELVYLVNCLYHQPGDPAIALAKQILEREPDLKIKERARRVLNRS